MIRALTFASREEAERHATALGRTSVYTAGGRPRLPRCDSGKWDDPQIRQGRLCRAPCPCKRRDQPDPTCPYVTTADAEPIALSDGTYAVPVTRVHVEARGERIDVDGTEVVVDDTGATDIDDADRKLTLAEAEPADLDGRRL